jgi:hypothetical protein
MDVKAVITEAQAGWQHMPGPADPAAVAGLASAAPVPLPAEYLALLRLHDGGEGELGAEPGWFQLWPAAEVLAANRYYQLPEFLPGFLGFGSSGGGELLALDCRGQFPWPVVMVPFIPLDGAEALPVAADFGGFVRLLGRVCPDAKPDAAADGGCG